MGRRRGAELATGEDWSMKKNVVESVALLGALVFVWNKLGTGMIVKETTKKRRRVIRREYPSKIEVGYMSQAAWQAKYGGSYLDYQDWLRGV